MVVSQGELRGMVVSQQGPQVSHLLFADDTLVFCQATQEALQRVGRILREFEAASGLMVNLEKSSIAFSCNVPENLKNDLASMLGVRMVTKHDRYLGLPALDRGVQIWKDKWLPRPLSFQVITQPNTLGEDAKLEELLDSEEGWDEELIHFVFLPMDVDIIVGINRVVGSTHSLHWHYEKNGRYSVKSPYRLITNRAHTHLQSGPIRAKSFKSDSCRFIWQATVPSKIRLFAWRACRDSLPTSSNLQKRGMAKDEVCMWCDFELDDLLHTILRCHFSRLVWALSHLPWSIIASGQDDPELSSVCCIGTSTQKNLPERGLLIGPYGVRKIGCYLKMCLSLSETD
ncbi:UNVERIFIED_CONTAM: hypothetical protein Slati_2172900 [Sesamum latifolium]|uniref:Reverse transcriptase zinc-binding domain-containing protein n=1 Tax=Sesamum latifolium TaxID=2727402 RepID=A0AAW2WS05_9LAMI